MANTKSHHLNNREIHVLVAMDKQPREASYTTLYEDGTKGASVHVLYWEKNPDKANEKGEVRSCPYEDYPKLDNPIVLPPEPGPTTFESLIGRDASILPEEAQDALRMFGGVDNEGRVLAPGEWAGAIPPVP